MADTSKTSKALNQIKSRIFSVPDSTAFDKIDSSLNNVSDLVINKDASNYAEMLRRMMTDVLETKDFQNISSQLIQTPDNLSRVYRYVCADEIVDSIPTCARAINVLANEIVSPDEITKEIFQFLEKGSLTEKDRKIMENVKALNRVLEIENKAHDVVYNTLLYGDHFIEICDYKAKEVPITQTLLSEGNQLLESDDYFDPEFDEFNYITEGDIIEPEGKIYEFKMLDEEKSSKYFQETSEEDMSPEDEQELIKTFRMKVSIVEDRSIMYDEDFIPEDGVELTEGRKKKKENTYNINNVKLLMHDPATVVALQSRRFRMCLGYLVLPMQYGIPITDKNSPGRTSSSGLTGMPTMTNMFTSSLYGDYLTGIEQLYNDMMKTIQNYVGYKANELAINKKDVLELLQRTVKEHEEEKVKRLKIRYVPPERMQHFVVDKKRFFPYGESIYHKINFSAKLLIAMETAITIKRMSDSSEKRLIYIETSLPRQIRNSIDQVKEAMQKKKHSIGTMGGIASIPTMLTTFENIYIPQNKGKRYVEFDTLQSSVNLRDMTDELKFYRDNLVTFLEIPPAYLNIEENLSNKAALSHESILFARTIVNRQTMFQKCFRSLFQKVYRFIYQDTIPNDIVITFAPPKMLQAEMNIEYFRNISDIIQVLVDRGIPEDYLLKKYMPLDWDEIEISKTESAIQERLSASIDAPEAGL